LAPEWLKAARMSVDRPNILVVDDDVEIGTLLVRYLGGHGFEVATATTGAELRTAIAGTRIDLLLLDLGLPDEDGLTLLRDFQGRWKGPVIVISGRGESVERVVGLELGADDYITKPFDLRELLARIRSVLRRSHSEPTSPAIAQSIEFDSLVLQPHARRLVGRDGEEIPLTAGEFKLLSTMIDDPGRVLSRDQLMNALHGRDVGPYDRSIDVQIGRLRRKLEVDASNPRLIKSVRGEGYALTAKVRRI
jgi:two-component system OmpR family response regulator